MLRRKQIMALALVAGIAMGGLWGYAGKEDQNALPTVIDKAVKKLYPRAKIREVEQHIKTLIVFEVELDQDGRELDVVYASDGTLMETEAEVTLESLPPALRQNILKAADGGIIKEVERETVYGIVSAVKLNAAVTTYDVEVLRDGHIIEITIDEAPQPHDACR